MMPYDRHGHALGDEAVKLVGGALPPRKPVLACRYGGDEFGSPEKFFQAADAALFGQEGA